MNILHTETLKKWGGQQNRVLVESIGLGRRGHTIVLACNTGSMIAKKAAAAGIRVYEMNMAKQAYAVTVPKLIGIIRDEKIDIVATHSSVDSWAGGVAAKITGTRLVRFRHNLYHVGRDPLTRLIYALPKQIVAISETVRDVMANCGIRRDRIRVIPSSVDIERFSPSARDIRHELSISPETLVIGNTSTFTGLKGQEYLLKAFNLFGRRVSCILLFAGRLTEDARKNCFAHVDRDLQDRIVFLGHRDDIPQVLKTIDIFVFPSYLEGLGTALLEAMAMERPVAVSDIPTFRTFIQNRVNGIFFRQKDPVDIADKVHALAIDAGLRDTAGRNARETVVSRFSCERMLDDTEALYHDMLR